MFDIVDVLAVHEVVERQTPVRRRICEMIMADYARWEIRRELGLSRGKLHRHMRAIRESFCEMGFDDWLLPRRAKERSRPQVLGDGRPMAIVGISWREI